MSEQLVQISACTFNSVAITGITAFSYDDAGTSVKSRADGETRATAQKLVLSDTTGSIEGIDQETFAGVSFGTSSTLVVTGKQVSDDASVTITVSNCMLLGHSAGVNHSSEGTASITWEATSPDGSTSPIAYA